MWVAVLKSLGSTAIVVWFLSVGEQCSFIAEVVDTECELN
jgi:hypothetical protein